jgi:hypothetical protein
MDIFGKPKGWPQDTLAGQDEPHPDSVLKRLFVTAC